MDWTTDALHQQALRAIQDAERTKARYEEMRTQQFNGRWSVIVGLIAIVLVQLLLLVVLHDEVNLTRNQLSAQQLQSSLPCSCTCIDFAAGEEVP